MSGRFDDLQIALIGCGSWGVNILRDLKLLGAKVAVVGRSEATRNRALSHGADTVVERIDQLGTGINGIVVATLSDTHGPVIVECAYLGVPFFVEKPLASSLRDAKAAIAAAPGRVFVMEKWRYHPGIERMRRLVAENTLGEIQGISTVRLGWSMTHFELDPIWHLLPHDLSIIDHILGFIPPPKGAYSDPLGRAGGGLFAFLGPETGPNASIWVSAYHPVTQRSVAVSGSRATVTLAGSYHEELTMRVGAPGSRDAKEERISAKGPLPLYAEIERFLTYLLGGAAPLAPAEDSLRIVEAIVDLRQMAGLPEDTTKCWLPARQGL